MHKSGDINEKQLINVSEVLQCDQVQDEVRCIHPPVPEIMENSIVENII